ASGMVSGSGTTGCLPQTYQFTATFYPPPTPGVNSSCEVKILSTPAPGGVGGGSAYFLMLKGATLDNPYAWKVTPPSLPFGSIPAGGQWQLAVDIQTLGTQPFTPAFSANDPVYGVPTGTLIPPTVTSHFNVTCTPSVGPHDDTLTITAAGGQLMTT